MSKQIRPIDQFRNHLNGAMRDEVAKQLPKGVDVDRFVRTAITVVQMNPELLEANRNSLYGAVMLAAKDGLLPDGREATIQVYNTNIARRGEQAQWVKMAQYMPMVGGLIRRMYEAGATYVDAAAVYERDQFRFVRGDSPMLEHEPYLGAEDPGQVVAAYAVIRLSNGEIKREVMSKRDIEKVRSVSKAANGPGWTKWYDQFAIKAVIKRAYKQLPHEMLERVEQVIEHDNAAMDFDFGDQAKPEAIAKEDAPAIEHKRPTRLDAVLKQAEPVEREQPASDDGQRYHEQEINF